MVMSFRSSASPLNPALGLEITKTSDLSLYSEGIHPLMSTGVQFNSSKEAERKKPVRYISNEFHWRSILSSTPPVWTRKKDKPHLSVALRKWLRSKSFNSWHITRAISFSYCTCSGWSLDDQGEFTLLQHRNADWDFSEGTKYILSFAFENINR